MNLGLKARVLKVLKRMITTWQKRSRRQEKWHLTKEGPLHHQPVRSITKRSLLECPKLIRWIRQSRRERLRVISWLLYPMQRHTKQCLRHSALNCQRITIYGKTPRIRKCRSSSKEKCSLRFQKRNHMHHRCG